jgi:uncharacterized membrane protein
VLDFSQWRTRRRCRGAVVTGRWKGRFLAHALRAALRIRDGKKRRARVSEVSMQVPEPAADNIRAIVELERRAQRERGWQERISDSITAVAGSLAFVLAHIALFGAWAAWNTLAPPHLRFDPYPYGLLTFIVSLEGVLVAAFVLITQNRMSRQSDARDHLNLQVDLLAEQELTMLLRMMRRVSEHVGVPPDTGDAQDAAKLAEHTNVHELMRTIEREVPACSPNGADAQK